MSKVRERIFQAIEKAKQYMDTNDIILHRILLQQRRHKIKLPPVYSLATGEFREEDYRG